MNKIFKVIWNAQINSFVVVSELAKGYCKSSHCSRSVNTTRYFRCFALSSLALALQAICLTRVNAEDILVHDFTPENIFEQNVSGVSRLTGSFSNIQPGKTGFHWTTLGQARADGFITEETAGWIDFDILRMGSQAKPINYVDQTTGSVKSMAVYDTGNIKGSPASKFNIILTDPVGNQGQYVDRNFYQAGAGASLDVDVGIKDSGWINSPDNLFKVFLKSSVPTNNLASVFHVTDNGKINYQSKTVVQLGNDNSNARDSGSPVASMTAAKFVGDFSSVVGNVTVNNIDDFKKYNDKLIKAIQNGKIKSSDEYLVQLDNARDTSLHAIYANTIIPSDDATKAQVNRDAVSYIHGENNATVTINKDANIQLINSNAAVVNLNDNSILTNNGTLGTAKSTLKGAYVVSAHDSSVVENNGVIDAGTNPEIAGAFTDNNDMKGAAAVAQGVHWGILANGQSVISNNGVINVASAGSYYGNVAAFLGERAIFNNNGVINIAAGEERSSIEGNSSNIGAEVRKNTVFNNKGVLYIGRQAQRNAGAASEDLTIKQASIGVHIYDNGTYNGSDDSQIVIGSKVQNASAIDVGGPATLNQKGRIDVNGRLTGDTISNVGIIARDGTKAAKVVNSGVINLNGLNSIAVQALTNAQVTSSGTININGGLDPLTRYANYGVYAKGEKALAILSGTVNLSGDGAIGVHAREKGEIDVIGRGTVNFTNGINQTGYFIHGVGSAIKNAAISVQDASTEGATLYRVDSGASFAGSADSAAGLNASGKGATIIRTTGVGSNGTGSHFDSGKLTLSVTGTGATGIRIEGGATGEITPDAMINVAGKDTTAGIVDGNYYKLDGSVDAAKKGDSRLTSYAALGSANTADGASGYIARNGGRLIHRGSIDFTVDNSTGVLVDGGILENRSSITVNGVAVNIQGADSTATNSGIVTATNGTAAYLVGNNATLALGGYGETRAAGTANGILLDTGAKGLIVDGATISMDSAGSGNAIENKAAISGIQLTDTTINVGNGVGVHTGASMAQTNSGTINVNGSGTGILFENVANSSETDQTLDMSGSRDLTINVNAAEGNGIVTRASTDLKTGASVNVLNSAGKSALVVEGTTKNVEQSGKLASVADDAAVVNLNNGVLETFTNKGDILAADANHRALEMTGGKGIVLTNAGGASIRGQVNLLSGDNTAILQSGSSATDVTGGAGNDRFILQNIRPEDNDTLFTSLNGSSGEDTLRLENSTYTLNRADAISGMEHIDLASGSVFTLDKVALGLGDDGLDGDGTGYSIDGTSLLNVLSAADVAFNSHLAGTGTMMINTAGNHVNFTANNADDGFAGTVALTNSQFELGGLNTRALSNATLRAGEGSITRVAAGKQRIGAWRLRAAPCSSTA